MRMHSGLAAPHAAPIAAQEAAPALDPGAWFEAATSFGPVRLCAFIGAPVRHAADAALALHRCEALLGPLQQWSAQALDWRWLPAAGQRVSGASHGCARWQRRGEGSAGPTGAMGLLSMPWPLLRSLPPPPAELAASLRWPAQPVVLSVAQFHLAEDELAQVEPGGAIVLADSLAAPWLGRLRAATEPVQPGLGAPVALAPPSVPRLVRARPGGGPVHGERSDSRVACEVRLAMPHTLPGDRLTGWRDDEPLPEPGPQASLWCGFDPREPALCLAEGRLMPWGDGWALAIHTLRRFGERAD
ncbi:hypothetical protein [Piscinibacter sp. XHJ-5]|uniref:hypothetical protein n=1 Tax=Piscinibacter sp. XHJ-5 TaxID=3037797 RepID=UPI002452BD85|nr:hypothetical protein [Piscinibacter sp. XHJ-5]